MTGIPQIGFTLFGLQAGDIVVADRGYCRRGQLAYALRSATQVVVRLAVPQVPLLDERGEPFDMLAWLKALGSGHHCCFVAFEHEGRRFAGRLMASSLPEEAAERARAKERQKAEKQATSAQRGDPLPVWLVAALQLAAAQPVD